jgi:hypothetical protein
VVVVVVDPGVVGTVTGAAVVEVVEDDVVDVVVSAPATAGRASAAPVSATKKVRSRRRMCPHHFYQSASRQRNTPGAL